MAMNTEVKIDDNKYYSGKLDRTTSAPRHNPGTIIKYIAPRVISSNISGCIQGSPHGFAWCNIGSTFPTALTTTASLGLASLVEHSLYTTIPSIHSINGERIIDEHRELSRLTETLGDVILQCCTLEVHNNAQELQIEWLESHRHENGLIISKMYQAEISSAKKIIDEKLEHKPALEKKLNETEKSTSVFDEQYQQLLAKRNAFSRELFDFERQIAQNNAESQFLQRRIHHLDDESKFYLLKNHALHARKVRLRHEYDEEIFSQQSVKLEVEILESEKITCEDTHITSKDDIQKSIDITQVAGMQSPKYYSEQLNNEVQRIRNEYEKKIAIYREELHRKFELELHRYQIQKSRPSAAGTQDYQLKFEQYDHEKKDVSQQVAAIRGRINQITIQIETSERQIIAEKNDQHSTFHSKRHLSTLNQLILDREKQLNEAFRIRNALKYQIDKYKERLHRYSRDKTQVAYSKRATVHETTQSSMSTNSSMFRYSLQDLSNQYNEQRRPLTPCSPPKIIHSPSPPSQQQRPRYSSIVYNTDLWEEGTLTRFPDFNIDQDCEELHRLLNNSNQDELAIIRIFCNRNMNQRLQIRERYKNRFNQNLGDALDLIVNDNLSKLLRILLLSPIERDCFELRRILKGSHTDENILVEIFFSRSNKHIQTLRTSYQKLFNNTLEQDIIGDRDDHSKRIFLALLQSNRPEDNDVNDNQILRDAGDLYETGTKWKTDGSTFVRLLCTRSNIQLKQIFAAYEQFSKVDIEQSIQVYTEGSLCQTLMAIVRIIRNRPRFFADGLQRSLTGALINEDNLNRIIVSRCETDMVQIKSEYEKITKRTLYDQIQTDVKGSYRRGLLELLRQRIELNTNEFTSQFINQQPETIRNQNPTRPAVQWREPISGYSSDSLSNRSQIRNVNDRTVIEKHQTTDHRSTTGPFDRNKQTKGNTSFTINTKIRSNYLDRRSFVRLPTTHENHSHYNNHDE